MIPKNIHFENGQMGTLMVWLLGEEDRLVQYQLQLLARQKPYCLLPCLLRYRFDRPQLCQDISGLVPLDQIRCGKNLTPDIGRKMILSIAEALASAADHLLPIRQISLQPSLVFLEEDFQVRLAFWPVHINPGTGDRDYDSGDPGGNHDLKRLIQLLGNACQIPADEIAVIIESLSEGGITKLILYLKNTDINEANHSPHALLPEQKQGKFACMIFGLCIYICDKIRRFEKIISLFLKSLLSEHDEDAIHPDDCQTVLITSNPDDFRMAMLSEGQPGTPEESEGTRAFILVDEFLVGRDPKNADLCLNDPGIGRMHARILRRAGSFFICDLGSRNGTKLDGKKLLKYVEQLLPDQCVLQFAEKPFYFHADSCS